MEVFRSPGSMDGWWPRVDPATGAVVFGSERVTAIHPPGLPGAVWSLGSGRKPRFIRPGVVTFLSEIDNERAFRMECDLSRGIVSQTSDDPNLASGNDFEAGGGHWGSYRVSGRRVTYDGRLFLSGNVRAVRVAGRFLLTIIQDVDGLEYFVLYRDGQKVAAYPLPQKANDFTLSPEGHIGYGYWWEAGALLFNGSTLDAVDVTVTPWRAEGLPVIVSIDGEIWIWTPTESSGRGQVLGRPLGSDRCIVLDDFPVRHDGLSVGYLAGWGFVVAGCDSRGVVRVYRVDRNAARVPVLDTVRGLGRPAFYGGFFATTDKYPQSIAFPQNCEVIVEASAVARATVPVLVNREVLDAVVPMDPSAVLGLYVAAEFADKPSTLPLIEEEARLTRAAWRRRFPATPTPATVAYVTPGVPRESGWNPADSSIDVWAPQVYFELTEAPSKEALARWLAYWESVLPADRPWLICGQAYDRSSPFMRGQMAALAAVTPAFVDALRTRPWVAGLLWFAVHRPGGVASYADLLRAHRSAYAAIPGRPASLPVRAREDEDDVNPPGVTIESYGSEIRAGRDWRVRVRDRNNPGTFVDVEIVNGSLHVQLTNPKGSDRSGSRRPVAIKE